MWYAVWNLDTGDWLREPVTNESALYRAVVFFASRHAAERRAKAHCKDRYEIRETPAPLRPAD